MSPTPQSIPSSCGIAAYRSVNRCTIPPKPTLKSRCGMLWVGRCENYSMTEKQLQKLQTRQACDWGTNSVNEMLFQRMEHRSRQSKPMTPEDRRARKRELQRIYRARKKKEAAKCHGPVKTPSVIPRKRLHRNANASGLKSPTPH